MCFWGSLRLLLSQPKRDKMSRIRSLAIATATATALASCGTMPSIYSIDNSRTYNQSYDEVWEKLVQFFASRNIPIKNIAKDSGVIYAESMLFNDDAADCGTGGLWTPFGRKASFNVFVTRSTDRPSVSVNTEFQEMRRFDRRTETVTCNSKGVIENAVLDALN